LIGVVIPTSGNAPYLHFGVGNSLSAAGGIGESSTSSPAEKLQCDV